MPFLYGDPFSKKDKYNVYNKCRTEPLKLRVISVNMTTPLLIKQI